MALVSVKLGASAATHLWERRIMKKRDKEIEQERVRERERAKEKELRDQTSTNTTIEHKLSAFRCGSCNLSSAGWAFTCGVSGCTYFLHVVCSGAPVSLPAAMAVAARAFGKAPSSASSSSINSFAHRKDHPLEDVHSNQEFQCEHCFTNGIGRRFKCFPCDVRLHPVCAKNPTRLSTFLHPQHELQLRTKDRFRRCKICFHSLKAGQKGLNLRVYGCDKCKFRVHPTCSQLPQYVVHHDLHRMEPRHTLQLKPIEPGKTSKCDKCSSESTAGWHYVCSICSVNFDIQCILQQQSGQPAESKNLQGLALTIELFSNLVQIFDVTNILF